MNPQRNFSLLISLLLLTVATVGLAVYLGYDGSRNIDKEIFRVDNLQEVDAVVLTSRNDSVRLTFNGSSWVVNDKFKADANMVKVLFATLAQAEPRRLISGSVKDSISTRLDAEGTRVELFVDGENTKTFYAGGNESGTQAIFRNQEGEVYLMTIPGYKVYVSGIFELDEGGFRDKYIFNFRWENFKSLTTSFPNQPAESFQVQRQGDMFTIVGLETDTTKLYDLLDNLARLTADEFAGKKDVVDTSRAFMRIAIQDLGSRSYSLNLYRGEDPSRIAGSINGELVYFQTDRIREIMRPRSFFAKKE